MAAVAMAAATAAATAVVTAEEVWVVLQEGAMVEATMAAAAVQEVVERVAAGWAVEAARRVHQRES